MYFLRHGAGRVTRDFALGAGRPGGGSAHAPERSSQQPNLSLGHRQQLRRLRPCPLNSGDLVTQRQRARFGAGDGAAASAASFDSRHTHTHMA
eukprot:NODE_7525_length_435_cov_186.205263.p1 GENE.NODE_7525_length_435_cov_186.205263~~NODE_7525_length_435_cov_186.205263.p1  ORF type:complete len:93 (-),score=2.13 NODE_7525_length_435_cov_186.205263:110-388(-)